MVDTSTTVLLWWKTTSDLWNYQGRGVYKFSRHLRSTSELLALKRSNKARPILRTHDSRVTIKYHCHLAPSAWCQ